MPLKFFNHLLHQQKEKNKPGRNLGVGSLIDERYRLDAEIGRGGMGIVYRAHDIPNDRDVAIKVINLETANALSFQQFLLEAEITARLNHPHIVSVYETGTVEIDAREPSPYIVMELVEGTSLEEIGDLTFAKILDIGKQICNALEYAHGLGLVYRDLKPGNVLIEKRGFQYSVKLTDFGLARPRGMMYGESESTAAGTLFYLAPELIAGQPADIASDLYALGATLYEMITGRVPFSDFDEQTILSQHLESPVEPPSQSRENVPRALDAIVLRLLAKNPKDRFASAHEVWLALEQVTLTRDGDNARGNLPCISTELIGHEDDLAAAKHLLEANQLVTILNADDTLALATGAQLTDQFADGVWYVNLQSVDDPSLVLETITSVLGAYQSPNRSLTISLIEHIREKSLLLILSHCDHVLSACAQLAETILRTCPDVRILVASQQPLNLSAEKCYRASL